MSCSSLVQSRHINLLAYILIAIPFIAYFIVVNHFVVDIPVWDDYVNPLDMTNKAIQASSLKEKLSFLAVPMNGHIPFLPRVLLYIQYLLGVTSAIKTALIISNLGWMAATVFIIWYSHHNYKIPFPCLIPIPYFLLSIAHWEAMDFYSSAFQMYWGSGLLAIIGLVAISSDRLLLASCCFLGGLFSSGGTLAVYPVCIFYFLFTKQWKQGLLFLLYTLPVAWLYVYVSPPGNYYRTFPSIIPLGLYTMEFVGNLFSTGQWDLSPHATYNVIAGVITMIIVTYYCWKSTSHAAIKMIFFYIVIMAGMAGYMRMNEYNHAVSRYGMYSLLAATCTYLLLVANRTSKITLFAAIAFGLLGIALWVQALLICRSPLQANHNQRVSHMAGYIETHDPAVLSEITWNVQQAIQVLETSKNIGLYDYTKAGSDENKQ